MNTAGSGGSRRIGEEAQDRVLGYSQPSPSTSSGQALRDWSVMPKHTQDSRPGLLSTKAVQISGMVDSVALSLLAKLVPRPVMAKSGWGIRAVECRTYGAPHHPRSIPQPFRAGLTFGRRPSGPREPMGSLPRFSHAGTHEALTLPALKRVIRVETLSRSAQALLPPHKCGGSHHQFG